MWQGLPIRPEQASTVAARWDHLIHYSTTAQTGQGDLLDIDFADIALLKNLWSSFAAPLVMLNICAKTTHGRCVITGHGSSAIRSSYYPEVSDAGR